MNSNPRVHTILKDGTHISREMEPGEKLAVAMGKRIIRKSGSCFRCGEFAVNTDNNGRYNCGKH